MRWLDARREREAAADAAWLADLEYASPDELAEQKRQEQAEIDAFWARQSELPWRERDGLWWISVFGANVLFGLLVIAVLAIVVVGIADLL